MSGAAVIATLLGQGIETGLNTWENRRREFREENAYARAVADMKRSGLNPILAAGNPAKVGSSAPGSIDTNMANDLLVGAELQKLKLENKGLNTANEMSLKQLDSLKQEYDERARNIKWYVDHKLPSDKPSSLVNEISQALETWKNGGENGTSMGAAVDTAKAVAGGVNNATTSMGNTVWKMTPMFVKKQMVNQWKKDNVSVEQARKVLIELETNPKQMEELLRLLGGKK